MSTEIRRLKESDVLVTFKSIIPSLTNELYKGDCGRVGVIGGCREYTGAPYFSAYSALKIGCDLSHVFCSTEAASVIKTYSPELIVHPYLKETTIDQNTSNKSIALKCCKDVSDWFTRLDSLVIGPGLGQDPLNVLCATEILKSAIKNEKLTVLDADSLYIISKDINIIKDNSKIALTPNLNELKRICNTLNIRYSKNMDNRYEIVEEIAKELNGPMIISKGSYDIISNNKASICCTLSSSPRRCGGLGDVLSGLMATFLTWMQNDSNDDDDVMPLAAAYGACYITRLAATLAFKEYKRSMVTSNVIDKLNMAFESI